jgi:rod shape-determining protein MreC
MTRSSSQALLALVLILVAAGLLVLNLGGFLTPVESQLLRPVGGLEGWISLRFYAIRDLLSSPSDVASLRAEVQQLQSENAQLQQEIIGLREQVAQAAVLSTLVQYARSQPDSRYVAASVISRDVSPFLRSIWIGAGSDDGVARGMPVVTDRGLVGRVVEVFASVSRVQLITDPDTIVNVRLQTSRADGTLQPQVNGELWVGMISQDAQVSPGEVVLTSGLGGNYPADIPVGTLTSIRRRDYELFQQAVLQPSVDFNQLELVLVITNFQPLPFNQPGGP